MASIPYIKTTTKRLSKDKIKEIGEAISNMCNIALKQDDITAWRMINGNVDLTEYDYLSKMTNPDTGEDYVFPAKLRWIPIQRKNVNALTGIKARREFRFNLRAVDSRSLEEKQSSHMRKLINTYLGEIDQKNKELEFEMRKVAKEVEKVQGQYQQVQQQYQVIQQQAEETGQEIDPKMTQEIEQQLEMFQEHMEGLQDQMDLMQKYRDNNKIVDDMNYEDIHSQIAKDDVDANDRYINILVKTYRDRLEAIRKSDSFFRYSVVTGKGYFYINLDENLNIEYEPKDSTRVYYPYDENTYWIHNGKWQALREQWSKSSFMSRYEEHLSEKDKEYYGKSTVDNTNFFPTPDASGAIEDPGASKETDTVDILRIWYKHPRKINVKDGEYLDDDIKNPDKELYVQERYEIVFADGKFVKGDIDAIQPRMADNMQEVLLPLVGKSYVGIGEEAYSPVKLTKELAELYMVLHYQKELLIVASGVKGDIVDKSQIPDSMSEEEHRYHKKLGTMYIKTMDSTGRPINPSFNQWKSYDDTLPDSVQIIENMCQQLDQQIGLMMGVPPQVLGQVQRQDQVGTFEMSNEQALIVTETLFSHVDEVETEAMNVLANLLGQYKNTEDDIVEIYQNEELLEFAMIPANVLQDRRFASYSYQNAREERNLKELKQLVLQQSQAGLLPFDAVIQLYDSYNLKDLKTSIRFMMKKAEQMQQKAQQADLQGQMEAQRAAVEAAQEYEMMKEKVRMQVKEMEIQVKQSIEQSKLALEEEKLKLKAKEVGLTAEIDIAKIESEREVEMAYLEDQSAHQATAHKLEALKMQLEIMNSERDRRSDEKIESKKVSSQKVSSKSYGKEKIKNK